MPSSVTSIAHWQKRIAEGLPSLSRSQAQVLGLISYGILLFDGCGMSRLCNGLAKVEQVPASRLRQRLREFYYEAAAKRGKKRQEVDVQACFGDLLAGIVQDWQGEKALALSLDASTLGERFTVLNLSVMYRGCGIPVAWIILPAKQEGSWRPHWEGLLEKVAGVVPKEWKVIVMADRGLYAAWLFRAIQRLGWHPMLRVNETLSFCAKGESSFAAIGTRVRRQGRGWKGQGEWSEEGERMAGTLLIRWEKGYEEQLAVVTDLPEQEAEAAWYQMRFWIEGEYKDHKSGGWGWQQTKMVEASRAERLWLAMAVAMQQAVLVGGQEEAREQEDKERKQRKGKPEKSSRRVGRPAKPIWRPRGREQSCLVRGQQSIKAALIRGEAIPIGHVVAEAWPRQTYRLRAPTSSWVKKKKEKEVAQRQRHQRRERKAEQKRAERQASLGHQREQAERQKQQWAEEQREWQDYRAEQARKRAQAKQEQEADRRRIKQERKAHTSEQTQKRERKHGLQEERQQELAQKREQRLRLREEQEQERRLRRFWHQEVQREREERQRRKAERAARGSQAAPPSSSARSSLFTVRESLTEPPEPP